MLGLNLKNRDQNCSIKTTQRKTKGYESFLNEYQRGKKRCIILLKDTNLYKLLISSININSTYVSKFEDKFNLWVLQIQHMCHMKQKKRPKLLISIFLKFNLCVVSRFNKPIYVLFVLF